jgi:hypothetical protein
MTKIQNSKHVLVIESCPLVPQAASSCGLGWLASSQWQVGLKFGIYL